MERRWPKRILGRVEVRGVGPVVGVYELLSPRGLVNYVSASRNPCSSLSRHLQIGDIPCLYFRAWQVDNYEAALQFVERRIKRHQPYYNLIG